MASWEQHPFEQENVITQLGSYKQKQLAVVTISGERKRIRNIFVRGVYWVDQATEVNTQYGTIIVGLARFPEPNATPSPGFTEGTGVGSQLKTWTYVLTAGQNNPTIFSLRYRAINIKSEETLWLLTRAESESSTAINHRVNVAGVWWESND